MAKYVVYIPSMDSFLMDGDEPYVDEEKEVKRVIAEETVHPKMYEPRPITFLKTWAKKQQKLEEEAAAKPYAFSPPKPEFHYKPKPDDKQYVLVVGDENTSKSGMKVQEFDSREEAITMALRSIAGLVKEFPTLGYYVLDTDTYGYTDGITASGQWRVEDFGHGLGEGKALGRNPWTEPEPNPPTSGKRRGRKPKQPAPTEQG